MFYQKSPTLYNALAYPITVTPINKVCCPMKTTIDIYILVHLPMYLTAFPLQEG